MKTAIQAIHKYLAPNCNWIYNQFVNFSEFNYLIVANSYQEPEKFPVEKGKLHYFPKMKVGKLSVLKHLYRALIYRMTVKIGLDNLYFYMIVKNKNVVLVHAHFADNGYKFLPLAKMLKVPLVVSFYGYDYDLLPLREPIWEKRYQFLFQNASAFICEGEYGKQKLISKGCSSEIIFVNHLGISVDHIPFRIRKWQKGNKFKFCQIASFVQKKGHEYTIRAFACFIKEYNNSELTLIGNGQKRDDLLKLVMELEISEKVRFIDFIPYNELYNELHKYHIFVHPSVTADDGDCEGGAPVILLDAQATGMPVISTYHCDIPEQVINEKSGFLVQERDVKQITNAMLEFYKQPELIEVFGKYGREYVGQNYNAKKCSMNLENIYKKVSAGYKDI